VKIYILFVFSSVEPPQTLLNATSDIPSFNVLPIHALNCFSIVKHETLVLSRSVVEELEDKIMKRLHSRIPLPAKYNYTDYKQKILDESEHEEDPVHVPFI
jgi:large subunit ribosomal protein L4